MLLAAAGPAAAPSAPAAAPPPSPAAAAGAPAGKTGVGFYGLGKPPSAALIAGWSIAVRPDGQGLPPGSGTVDHGADVFAAQCSACHGTFGEGEGRYPKLVSDSKLTGNQPEQTVGNYWPYATTLFDYIDRAMPYPAPHSLPPDDVYAIVAYILNLNNIVPADFVADRQSVPKVQMPNRNGFIWQDPRPDTADTECMADCRDPGSVKILSTAAGGDLTPRTTGPLDTMAPK
jgi:cytochrome c